MITGNRLELARTLGSHQIALALGLSADPRKGLSPCPACGAAQRGSKDKRGPVGLTPDGQGWRCHRCDASGDGLTLAAWVCTGSRDAHGQWAPVLDRLDTAGLLGTHRPPPPSRPPPSFPPRAEVHALWDRCVDGFDDPEVREWCAQRQIDLGCAIDRGLLRVLPAGTQLPRWAWGPHGAWTTAGYRLIVPLYDVNGVLVSLRARRVCAGEGPKALPPAGHSLTGCVMADPLGRLLLTQPAEAAQLLALPGRGDEQPRGKAHLFICEGEPDFLRLATFYGDADDSPGVLGIVAGSWSPALAARVPTGAQVLIDTDHDRNGDHYAEQICNSLPHCNVRRTHAESRHEAR